MTAFRDFFQAYLAQGLSPLPIQPGAQKPCAGNGWERFCTAPMTLEEAETFVRRRPQAGLGLCMGTIVAPNLALISIDIDDEAIRPYVEAAIGPYFCAKVGSKGVTVFALSDPREIRARKIKKVGADGKKQKLPAVEILAHGNQTVIPPTMHPKINQPYEWVGTPILELDSLEDLPRFTAWMQDEIIAILEGKGAAFIDLQTMTPAGEQTPGDVHNASLAAVGLMVARGWQDEAIQSRVLRAKQEAYARGGLPMRQSTADLQKEVEEWVESARAKGFDLGAEGPAKVPTERRMANYLVESLGGRDRVIALDGVIRFYKDGHWPVLDTTEAKRMIFEADRCVKNREAKEALAVIQAVLDREDFGVTLGVEPKDDPKRQRICLKNGTLDLLSGELLPHAPEHELLHQLDIAWDDDAKCPLYDGVVSQTFAHSPRAVALWDEFCALTLVADTSFQKMLFLQGPGRNGKGTLSRVLIEMHAPSAVGSVGITDLNDERKRTSLVGKLVNISGEQSHLNKVSDTYLKKITGGDPVDVRKLYGETRNNVTLNVRFVELVNEMPSTSDVGDALRRRLIILRTPVKVEHPDLELGKKLRAERAGVLRRWVAALARLYARGRFDPPGSSTGDIDEYLLESNPVALWAEERVVVNGAYTPASDLYGDFAEWARASGYKHPPTKVMFGRRLSQLGHPSETKRLAGKTVKCRGLTLIEGTAF